jgi:flagellar biosynthesis protein
MTQERDTTNLTAIALRYEQGQDDAPYVVAKGQREMAETLLKEAEKYSIPIQKNPDLAKILSKVECDEPIPIAAYMAVAEILKYIYAHYGKGESL